MEGPSDGVPKDPHPPDAATETVVAPPSPERGRGFERDLHAVVRDMQRGIVLKSRIVRLKRHKGCFSGSDAVGWMVARGHSVSVDESVGLCQRFLEMKLITHVNGSAVFKAKKSSYYQFSEPNSLTASMQWQSVGGGAPTLDMNGFLGCAPPSSRVEDLEDDNQQWEGPMPDVVIRDMAFEMMTSLPVTRKMVGGNKKKVREVFEGRSAVQWMLVEKYASEMQEAVMLCNFLLSEGLIEAIGGGNTFKADSSFYRFGKCRCNEVLTLDFVRGCTFILCHYIQSRLPKYKGPKSEEWTGADAVMCLMWAGVARGEEDAVTLGQAMLQTDMIVPVLAGSREFRNDLSRYTFKQGTREALLVTVGALQAKKKSLASVQKMQKISQTEEERIRALEAQREESQREENSPGVKGLFKKITGPCSVSSLPASPHMHSTSDLLHDDTRRGGSLRERKKMAFSRSTSLNARSESSLPGSPLLPVCSSTFGGGTPKTSKLIRRFRTQLLTESRSMEVLTLTRHASDSMEVFTFPPRSSHSGSFTAQPRVHSNLAPDVRNAISATDMASSSFGDPNAVSGLSVNSTISMPDVSDTPQTSPVLINPPLPSTYTAPSTLVSLSEESAFASFDPSPSVPVLNLKGAAQYVVSVGQSVFKPRCNKRPRQLFIQHLVCTTALHPPCNHLVGPQPPFEEGTPVESATPGEDVDRMVSGFHKNNPAVAAAVDAITISMAADETSGTHLGASECIERMKEGFLVLVYPRKDKNKQAISDVVETKHPTWQHIALDHNCMVLYRRHIQGLCSLRLSRVDDVMECRRAWAGMEVYTGVRLTELPEVVAQRTVIKFHMAPASKPIILTFRTKAECDIFIKGWAYLTQQHICTRDLSLSYFKNLWLFNNQCDLDGMMSARLALRIVKNCLNLQRETCVAFDAHLRLLPRLMAQRGKLLPGWEKRYDDTRECVYYLNTRTGLVAYSEAVATGSDRGACIQPHQTLDFETFTRILLQVTVPPVVGELIRELQAQDIALRLMSGSAYEVNKGRISCHAFKVWLEDQQGETLDMEDVQHLVLQLCMDGGVDAVPSLGLSELHRYLISGRNNIMDPRCLSLYQDMSFPLYDYFIATSHNTYLTGDQLRGESSVEAYVRALLKGCRCLELDTWEGEGLEPIITHGHTFTTKILFRDVVQAIAKYAFVSSSYPVILSFENHCGPHAQKLMVDYMHEAFGDMLVTKELEGLKDGAMPSPEALKGRILVKAKATLSRVAGLFDPDRVSNDMDDEGYAEDDDLDTWDPESNDAWGLLSGVAGVGGNSPPPNPPTRSHSVMEKRTHSAATVQRTMSDAGAHPISRKVLARNPTGILPILETTPHPSPRPVRELREGTPVSLENPPSRTSSQRRARANSQGHTDTPFTSPAHADSRRSSKDGEAVQQQQPGTVSISPLAEVAIYTKAVSFPGLRKAIDTMESREMCSLGELKARKAVQHNGGTDLMEYTTGHLLRVYPAAKRINSSNYDPVPLWNCGVQMVALNYQTNDHPMQLNEGKFAMNGRCGYLLKPAHLRAFPGAGKLACSEPPTQFTFSTFCSEWSSFWQGLSGIQLEVAVNGVEEDTCSKYLVTTPKLSNEHVMWMDEVVLNITRVESAMFTFRVHSKTSTGTKVVAYSCCPAEIVRKGIRNIALFDTQGVPTIPAAVLLVHVKKGDLVVKEKRRMSAEHKAAMDIAMVLSRT